MENFCKHAEDHLDALDAGEDEDEVEGKFFLGNLISSCPSYLFLGPRFGSIETSDISHTEMKQWLRLFLWVTRQFH